MEMTISQLVEQCGVAARTIREYIRLGILPRPKGVGPAALYTREHVRRLWAVVALREQGVLLEDIKGMLATMTPREMAKYEPKPPVAEAPSERPPAADGAQASAGAHAFEAGAGAAPPHRLKGSSRQDVELAARTPLPGQRYSLIPLLPGMVLMVRDDAAEIVRRAAVEIVERYGAELG
jgi:DNA-binding transcriptional MerR regulator